MAGIRDIKNAREVQATIAAEEAQQKFEREAPIRAAVAEQSKLLAELQSVEQQQVRDTIFKEASEYLAANCAPYLRTDQTIDQIREASNTVIVDLKKYLLDEHGIEIQQSGMDKLARIYQLNKKYLDVTSLDNWKKIVKYLDDNLVFDNADLKVVRTVAPPAPAESEPTLADINAAQENQESLTREGAIASRKLAVQGLVLEAQPVFRAFSEHLVKHFDYYITKQEGDQCVEFLRRHNLRLDDPRSWDKCRTKLLNLKTPEEVYNEQMDIDSDVLTSREFAKKYRTGFKD